MSVKLNPLSHRLNHGLSLKRTGDSNLYVPMAGVCDRDCGARESRTLGGIAEAENKVPIPPWPSRNTRSHDSAE